ncbi:unnamed protein product [Parnassius mnemosyne]|uniref:Uncharacterized protein n=1 Tax=Parnassius mnemosyne TaxID=213953 RepID=A0AAV1L4I3_9NEOP
MITTYLLLLFFMESSSMSIGSASENQNVTESETTGDFYPDWVPFKNKQGDELGEFVEVAKRKPKKRLAPPANFVLKALVDQEGEEYVDKRQEEIFGEDYFEKKEWSAIPELDSINSQKSDPATIAGISEIVNILTKSKQKIKPLKNEEKLNKESKERENNGKEEETEEVQSGKDVINSDTKVLNKGSHKDKDDIEYDEDVTEKEKSEKSIAEQKEEEARKAKILHSVDELKERHAEEQRRISEKVKEEEMYEEERDREYLRHPRQEYDKYSNKVSKWKKVTPDYDEYDETVFDVKNKYKTIAKQPHHSTTQSQENFKAAKVSGTPEKLSVFKNPDAYISNEYEDSEETTTTINPKRDKTSKNKGSKKFSSKYNIEFNPKEEKHVRISLVPEDNDSKEGEPTLFFPKKRTNRRRYKIKTTTPEPYSLEIGTVQNKYRSHPTHTTITTDITSYDTEPTAGDTVPSAADTTLSESVVSQNANQVTDALPLSTDKKEEKQVEDVEYEKGGGKEHHASHEVEHEEHGKKAYEGVHEDTKTTKGHHDKEDHLGKYDDHGGVDKHHHDETGHYGHHHHEEHGKKHAKYEESGKHSKGHSTKGSHDIHKKEEYEKNVEFFEEDGDSFEDEKHGGHHDEKSHAKGGHFKQGKLKASHEGHVKGDTGHFSKEGFGNYHKGHKSANGQDHHGHKGKQHFHHKGKEAGNKWIYHHGNPPRTANLVPIDRRADPYLVNPRFFG